MGVELGRISGPLLANNLLRHGADLAFETDLLYLDVNSGKVGIKTSTPSKELEVNGTATTPNLIVDTKANIADLVFISNKIQNLTGSITITPDQTTDPTISTKRLETSKLDFFNRTVSTINANDNIELSPNGTGQVIFNTTKVNVNGSLHATGNVTFDGNIIIGSDNTDYINFSSDFASDLIPDVDNTFDLGTDLKQWNTLYSEQVFANTITTPSVTVNDINMLFRTNKIYYVSVNGLDTNYGNHVHSTFKTLKHALSVASVGDTVYVFPGTYEEEFPLTIPTGVTVTGDGIRAVTIIPTALTNTNDAFLLNGETTVENLTVKNFYYNSASNTGYAFRFADNCLVTTRSPYIRNITVITSDDVADAGRGALVDGSVANPASYEAAMLFHAVTFLLPNADGITATNGARVEWLNSFTYFCYRGIHLTNGTLGFANLGIKFGAEMRSINSANVYGTYGAVADGDSTLGYLIGHNFGYVGSGTNTENDDRLSIHANEIVKLNSGEIYFDSMDHKGNYRVGDVFFVEQSTGNVFFNAQSINFSATGSITLSGPGQLTIVDATKIQTGNIKIHDNTVESLIGDVNFSAASGSTYLNTTVNVTGSTVVSGDAIIQGNVFLGDTEFDIVTMVPQLTQDIKPGANNTYNLGVKTPTAYVWDTLFNTSLDIDGIVTITNNTIATNQNNNNLIFSAAGTGQIVVTSDITINNNLDANSDFTVSGLASLRDISLSGNVLLTGNIDQTGDTYIQGLFSNNNIIITGTGSYFSVPDIIIQNNEISATATDDNIVFSGNGTGGVVLDNRLKIVDNVISNVWQSATTDLQKSIVFTPTGIGNTVVYSNQYLQVPIGNNTNRVLSAVGEIRQNSTTGQYEGYQSYGNEAFRNVYSSDRKTYISPELTVGANDNILRFVVNDVVKSTIDSTKLFNATLRVGDFDISSNTIHNRIINADTEIQPTGTGNLNVNNLLIKDNTITNTLNSALVLQSTGNGWFKFGGTGAVVLPYGNNSQRRLTPEEGETRYNTEIGYMEVFNGTSWIPAVGTSGAAPLDEVLEIMDEWALILG